MNSSTSTNHLIASTLLAGVATAAIVSCFRYLDFPSGRFSNGAIQMALSVIVAACILCVRPILLRTILRNRRSPFLLDEDLNAILIGRMLGLLGGMFIGITLYTEFS